MGLLEFNKLPINTLVGADWKTFKAITAGREIDPFFCFGASFGAKSLRSFVLFLVPLLVILCGKVGISLPAKVSWSL